MMHGREKSDPAVVAMKPAKSAAQAEGELVERRAGAKGKAGEVARTGHSAGHACISNLLRLRHAYTLPSSPKVGARCLNWARRVLCGGRSVTGVPTATAPGDPKLAPVGERLVVARGASQHPRDAEAACEHHRQCRSDA